MASQTVWTPWGYQITAEGGTLDPIVSASDLAALSGGRLDVSDLNTVMTADAVSLAVRNFCGWHVAPVLTCVCARPAVDGRLLSLPALHVESVDAVTESGIVLSEGGDFAWREDGLMQRLCFRAWPTEWGAVSVSYSAGLTADMCQDLSSVVAQIALNSALATPGVKEEHAGSVGATYNQTANGVSGGITLLDRDKELLAPYALPRRW